MTAEATILGPLAVAIIRDGQTTTAFSIAPDGELLPSRCSVDLLLATGAEQAQILAVDASAVRDKLRSEVTKFRALSFVLSGADPHISQNNRRNSIVVAERMCAFADVRHFIRARLLGRRPAPDGEYEVAATMASEIGADLCAALYREVVTYAPFIESVVRHFDYAILHTRLTECDLAEATRALVDEGIIASAVCAFGDEDRERIASLPRSISPGRSNRLETAIPNAMGVIAVVAKRLASEFGDAADTIPELPTTVRVDPEDPWIRELNLPSLDWRTRRDRFGASAPSRTDWQTRRQKIENQINYIDRIIQKRDAFELEDAVLQLIRYQRERDTLELEHLCKSLSRLAALAVSHNEFAFAARLYAAAHVANQSDSVPLSGYAELLRKAGRLDAALLAYKRSKAKFKSDPVPLCGYADTLRQLGQLGDALAAYEDAKLRFPDQPVAFSGYAETLRDLGKLDEAVSAYSGAKVYFPSEPVIYSGYAATLRQLGQYDTALDVYRDAQSRFPGEYVSFTGYAETLREIGRLDLALEEFARAKTRFPAEPHAYVGYAETLRESGRLDQALAAYAEAKDRFRTRPIVFTGYARTLRELGRTGEALVAYSDARERFGNDRFTTTGYAETLRQMGRLQHALAVYEEARLRFPRTPALAAGAAAILRDMGRLTDAAEAYKEAIDTFPANSVPYCGYAATLAESGDTAAAERAYSEIMQRFPHERVARNALASLLVNTGRPGDALQLLGDQKPKTRADWRDYHVSAMAHDRVGNSGEAVHRLEVAVAAAPFHKTRVIFKCTLAAFRLRDRQNEEALDLLQTPHNVIPFPEWAILRAHAAAEMHQNARAQADIRVAEGRAYLKPVIRILREAYHLESHSKPAASETLIRKLCEEEFRLITAIAA